MIPLRINLEGLARIFGAIANVPEAVDAGLRDVATTLRSLVLGRSPVDTGAFKLSWGAVEQQEGGFSYTFTNPQPYGFVLEGGLYPGVGPRTVAEEGQIYSRQAPGGVAGPILEDPAVAERVAQLIADELERRFRSE